MKKFISYFILIFLFFWSISNALAVVIDDSWENIINNKDKVEYLKKIDEINDNFKLQKFSSKKNIEQFLQEKFVDNIINNCWYVRYYPEMLYDGVMLDTAMPVKRANNVIFKKEKSIDTQSISEESIENNTDNNSSEISYTKTNTQKVNVDEPEIVKNTKGYIFYFNKEKRKIYVLKSPIDLNLNKIDLNQVKIITEIKVPSLLQNDIQLLATDTRLVVLGTRNRMNQIIGSVKTDLLVYDISNLPKLKIVKLYESNWSYADARLINWKLFVISNYNLYNFKSELCDRFIIRPLKKDIENIYSIKEISYKDKDEEVNDLIKKYIKENNIKEKIKKEVEKGIYQKSIDISYNPKSNFTFKGKILPYDIEVKTPNKDVIYYIPSDFETDNYYNNNFNIITSLDIDNVRRDIDLNVIWWKVNKDNIHMSKNNLYLVWNQYLDNRIFWKYLNLYRGYTRWQFTMIHKLKVDDMHLEYINSALLTWNPINQYSMDEDDNWNFRIFLAQDWSNRNVNLFVLDKNLNLISLLNNIEPKEQFKSARFIGNKAYLVTFKATDPLFVIDMSNYKDLKVIGELKIPGYSLYLHPYGPEKDWIQYLIGIWQEAEEVHWNWSLPKNIKIDLYKIDYNKKIGDYCSSLPTIEEMDKCFKKANIKVSYNDVNCECPEWAQCLVNCDKLKWPIIDIKEDKNYNNIFVDQVSSEILGLEKEVWWMTSWTPVFKNPRTFVFDNKTKELILPVILTESRTIKENDNIEKKVAMPYYNRQKRVYFVWLKSLKKNNKDNTIKEIFSKNYIDKFKERIDNDFYKDYSTYTYKKLDLRAWKYWNIYYFLNNKFIDFANNKEDKLINFK